MSSRHGAAASSSTTQAASSDLNSLASVYQHDYHSEPASLFTLINKSTAAATTSVTEADQSSSIDKLLDSFFTSHHETTQLTAANLPKLDMNIDVTTTMATTSPSRPTPIAYQRIKSISMSECGINNKNNVIICDYIIKGLLNENKLFTFDLSKKLKNLLFEKSVFYSNHQYQVYVSLLN